MKNRVSFGALLCSTVFLMGVSKCESPELERSALPPFSAELEKQRRLSASDFDEPKIERIFQNGEMLWEEGQEAPVLRSGEVV